MQSLLLQALASPVSTELSYPLHPQHKEAFLRTELRQALQALSSREPLPSSGNAVIKDGYLYYSKNENEEPKKIEGVSNIKYLYVYNIGTGVNKVPFVLTEDGVVYRLNSQEKLVKYDELSTYQIDKIINHEGEVYDVWTILLKDGTTKKVEVKDEM